MGREDDIKLKLLFHDAEVSLRDARYYHYAGNLTNCLINLVDAVEYATKAEAVVQKEQQERGTNERK